MMTGQLFNFNPLEKNLEKHTLYMGRSSHGVDSAEVAKLADALDSKSSPAYPGCGFKSHLQHDILPGIKKAGCRAPGFFNTGFGNYLAI